MSPKGPGEQGYLGSGGLGDLLCGGLRFGWARRAGELRIYVEWPE